VNDAPVALPDAATIAEDTALTIAVLANDRDIDGNPLSVTAATAPNGTIVINADGTITYTPNANFNGTDTITYTISDGMGGFSTATVTVTVTAVNDAPMAVNDLVAGREDTPLVIAPLVNDRDVDGNPLTITTATAPNGTVVINPDGTITYTPNANFNGTDVITYRISDGVGGFATATITVNVAPVNDAPVAANDTAATTLDTPVRIAPLVNDRDIDGNPLTIATATAPNGTVIINPDGTITYTPNGSFAGTDVITYRVSDGNGGFATATITVTITGSNTDPAELLAFGDVTFPDRSPINYKGISQPGFISTPLIILDAVNGFRSLSGTPDIDGQSSLLAAVNGIASLNGNRSFDVDGSPITSVVEQLERITDFRFGAERLFDRRFGDTPVHGFTGFSVRPQGLVGKQVMIESVVHDQRIFVDIRDVGDDCDPRIVTNRISMRDGTPLPDWIKFDKRGLAIIERPLNVDEIHLVVRSVRADGKVITVPIVIQGATGEVQLDAKLQKIATPHDRKPHHAKPHHAPVHHDKTHHRPVHHAPHFHHQVHKEHHAPAHEALCIAKAFGS
jgi:large repetitive protein